MERLDNLFKNASLFKEEQNHNRNFSAGKGGFDCEILEEKCVWSAGNYIQCVQTDCNSEKKCSERSMEVKLGNDDRQNDQPTEGQTGSC